MSSEYSTIQQHEPLRTPANWGAQEKKFVAQLEEILDDIYKRFGRIKESDLGSSLRKSISKSTEGVSTLTQDSKAFSAAFQSIGTMGEATGVTAVTENGVTVEHTNIGGYTQLSADGLRIYDADGALLGGTYVLDSKVHSAVQTLINPKQDNFYVTVAPDDYEGEQSGMHFYINDVDAGMVSAAHNGTDGAFGFKSSFQTQITSDKTVYISGSEGVSIVSQGDIEFVFYGTNENTGKVQQMSLSMSEIWNAIASLLS